MQSAKALRYIRVQQLRHDPDNIRSIASTGNVAKLKRSIATIGLQSPLAVYASDTEVDVWYVVEGHSRLNAMMDLGWEHAKVPCLVIEKAEALSFPLLDHGKLPHRPYDKARRLEDLLPCYGDGAKALARAVGYTAERVHSLLQALKMMRGLGLSRDKYGQCHMAVRYGVDGQCLGQLIKSGHVRCCAHVKLIPFIMQRYKRPWEKSISLQEMVDRVVADMSKSKAPPLTTERAEAHGYEATQKMRKNREAAILSLLDDGKIHPLREMNGKLNGGRCNSTLSAVLTRLVANGSVVRVSSGSYRKGKELNTQGS